MTESARLPVFIVGSPRSGTTLLRLMLNRHPQIAIPDETGIFEFLHYYPGRQRSPDFLKPSQRQRFIQRFKTNPNFLKSFSSETLKQTTNYLEDVSNFDAKSFVDALFRFHCEAEGKVAWGEKTPRHALFADSINRMYPGSPILYVVRDPRAVFASMKRYAQTHDGPLHFWMTTDAYRGATMWRDYYMAVQQYSTIHYLRHEDLIKDAKTNLERICNSILNIEFDESMLEFAADAATNVFDVNAGKIPEWHNPTLGKLTHKSTERWREQLSDSEQSVIERLLRRELLRYEYVTKSDVHSNKSVADSMHLMWLRVLAIVKRMRTATKIALLGQRY